MAEISLIKSPGGNFAPAHESDAEQCAKIKNGALVLASIKQPRNPQFHRKFFALINFAFEYWAPEPVEIGGETRPAQKNIDRFRKDVMILAGFRTVVVNLKNEVRYEAESISFASMDETRFHDVYRAVFGVCWKLVLSKVPGMTEEEAERCVNEAMSFA